MPWGFGGILEHPRDTQEDAECPRDVQGCQGPRVFRDAGYPRDGRMLYALGIWGMLEHPRDVQGCRVPRGCRDAGCPRGAEGW